MDIVLVKLPGVARCMRYDATGKEISPGDWVVVEGFRGIQLGRVVKVFRGVTPNGKAQIPPVIRKGTEKDLRRSEENREKEKFAHRFCLERIEARNLPMKLVRTEYLLDRSKVVFYFTADGRVDFRELVRDLAQKLRTRIEMRQIGVRDEARMIGGIGPCGKELCCASHLNDFEPISVKLAKDQNLVLNPAKLSGLCGRLMCCLIYEHGSYALGNQVEEEEEKGYPEEEESSLTAGADDSFE
ncbi:MAG: hypothetical protein D6713_02845 [Deltaproteobacteria bacterium]|nr:MAG: hypothetical protein D6713_02845 [Deltaproteobacteria bacterium]